MDFKTRLCSSLTKIMPLEEPPEWGRKQFSVLKGERFSFQIACFGKANYFSHKVMVKAESELEKYVHIRRVENVPVDWFPENLDKDVLSDKTGFFPDVLYELEEDGFFPFHRNIWNTLWIDVDIPRDCRKGKYAVKVIISVPQIDPASNANYTVIGRKEFSRKVILEVLDAELPAVDLKNSCCIFPDCLAGYYNEPLFSSSHWKYVEEFMKTASEYSLNMLYTPLFPFLPEEEGEGEEAKAFPQVQLIKIRYAGGNFSFDFSLLQKWISCAGKAGIKYFEFSHFFLPGKIEKLPCITVEKGEGEEKCIFTGERAKDLLKYEKLLSSFLPLLEAFIEKNGLQKRVYFHAFRSQFPVKDKKATSLFASLREKYPFFAPYPYFCGKDKEFIKVVPAVKEKGDGAVKDTVGQRWINYGNKHKKGFADPFIHTPSFRNRIIGFLSYYFAADGIFLPGFNFYSSFPGKFRLDPYSCTCSYFSSPAGSRFLVYPGKEGKAVVSLRLEVFLHGMQDRCALVLLESLTGREKILRELDNSSPKGRMDMKKYPAGEQSYWKLRARINFLIRKNLTGRKKQNKEEQ